MDLNLLAAFDVLARERSVTRAAERAGVTQSAMSHTLRRLRGLIGDELMVRGKSGMVLTPRAQALIVPVRGALLTLSRAISAPAEFDPLRLQRTFRLVTPDTYDLLMLPPLLRHLQSAAPAVNLAVVPPALRVEHALETGDVDLAVVPELVDGAPFVAAFAPAPDLQKKRLLKDCLRCFVRPGHPVAHRRRLTRQAYAALPHILVSPTGAGPGVVDRYLEVDGLRRRIALRVPVHSSALSIVASTDLVLTGPRSLERTQLGGELVSLPVPVRMPDHALSLVWHPRFSQDPAHRFLRDVLLSVTRQHLRSVAVG